MSQEPHSTFRLLPGGAYELRTGVVVMFRTNSADQIQALWGGRPPDWESDLPLRTAFEAARAHFVRHQGGA